MLALQCAIAIAGLFSFGWLVLAGRRFLAGRRIRARQRRGAAGQRRGRELLRRRGFEILAEEHPLAAEMRINDQIVGYDVRIDYLVRKGGRTYGVEVKTGERATDPLHRPTRRQLLEYSRLLPGGLLLLDMEAEELLRIGFPSRRPGSAAALVGLGFLLGIAAAALLGAALAGG